ncbi:hypothetical protein B0H13DRAFT_1860985 [Mycena leptocephala]|nr:hypothetical protein B0H13DRAFT_1860985 [Mycena leptocephala]
MSALVAFWVVAVLYGAQYCRMKCVQSVLFAVTTIQFILATAHNIVCVVQLINGFTANGKTVDGPFFYFLNMGSTEHVLQEAFYATNSLIGDGILAVYIDETGIIHTHTHLNITLIGATASG